MRNVTREYSLSALLVGIYESDRLLVQEIFRQDGWRLFEAGNRRGALQCLARNPVEVVIAEKDVPGWNWKQVLRDIRRLASPPQLIVTSRNADDHLWAEALNVGAYDVLPQPLDRDEVERVVASARRHFDVQPSRAGRARAAVA